MPSLDKAIPKTWQQTTMKNMDVRKRNLKKYPNTPCIVPYMRTLGWLGGIHHFKKRDSSLRNIHITSHHPKQNQTRTGWIISFGCAMEFHLKGILQVSQAVHTSQTTKCKSLKQALEGSTCSIYSFFKLHNRVELLEPFVCGQFAPFPQEKECSRVRLHYLRGM